MSQRRLEPNTLRIQSYSIIAAPTCSMKLNDEGATEGISYRRGSQSVIQRPAKIRHEFTRSPISPVQRKEQFCTYSQVPIRLYGDIRNQTSSTASIHIRYAIKCFCTVTKIFTKYFSGYRHISRKHQFSFALVCFCSEGTSDERVRVLMTSQGETIRFIMKVRMSEIS
jgi:hypothetical protein